MKTSFLDFDFLILRIKDYIPLNAKDEELISKLFVLEYFDKNELILKEGAYCQKLYFIGTGIVRLSLLIDGVDRTFVFVNEGAFCSDSEGFLRKTPSKFNISAIEPTTLLSITYDNLQVFYKEIPYGERFGRLSIEQLFLGLVSHFYTFYCESPEQRYLKFINQHKDLLQRIPQYHIASYVGVTPQALCRIKKKMLHTHL
ncbi:MAG: cyclic nucleotide-binding domain-containing protein [Bacteroidales bacterium]|jgi:CRP-like cAMP-binding protein|nr:cyclic nucleotide-binding domain-containing protein [Bacteroidales bacterium]